GVRLEQHLHALLDLGQPLRQLTNEVHPAFEGDERLLERQLPLLEPLHEPLELRERVLEARRRVGHQPSVSSTRARARLWAKTSATASPARSAAESVTTDPAASPWRTMA